MSHKFVPECATWKAWYGYEIEGKDQVGICTLFLRDESKAGDAMIYMRDQGIEYDRVWLCKEYDLNSTWVPYLIKHKFVVAIETTPELYHKIPEHLRLKARIFVKLDLPLLPGDHVCVGEAFYDEAFKIGEGVKMNPRLYTKDIPIFT